MTTHDEADEITAAEVPALIEERDRYRAALLEIVAESPAEQPEDESYHDTESASLNGAEVAKWESAEIARKALEGSAQTENGWILVPTTPTLEMQHAYFAVIDTNLAKGIRDMEGRYAIHPAAYAAMIAAAPKVTP
jgi:hypothetical protein